MSTIIMSKTAEDIIQFIDIIRINFENKIKLVWLITNLF